MADQDLSRLKIDKQKVPASRLGRRRKMVAWGLAVALVLLLGVLFFTGVLAPAVEVDMATVSQVYPSQTFTLLNASGYVVAQRRAAVSSKATGRLEWLGVEEGSRVRSGQVLARLENRDSAASRDQAAANLATSRANLLQAKADQTDADKAFARLKELVAQGIVAPADYDVAEARMKRTTAAVAGAESAIRAAGAALNGAEAALDYTHIRAPFDGVVLTKNADVGDIVTPLGAAANAKAAVVTMADMDSLQVEVDVSEANLEKIRAGQPCEVQLDALPGVRFPGAVHMIVPTADRSKATVLVKVRFLGKDSRILPEMSAKVAFLEREVQKEEAQPRTAVNPEAIAIRNGKKFVFVVKEERVVETEITTGTAIGGLTEVLGGVKAGEKVALKPLDRLRNNAKIKAAEK